MEKLNGVGFRPWIGVGATEDKVGSGFEYWSLAKSHYDWLKRNCPENKVTIEVVESIIRQCFPI